MKNGWIAGAGDPSSEGFEERLRKTRIGVAILVAVAVASLVAATNVYPVPLTFILFAFLLGGLIAVGLSFRRNNSHSIIEGIAIGIVIGSWSFLRDWLFPGMSDDFIPTFWPGMSAWALGFGLVALPLLRFSHERKRQTIRTDLASVQHYRESGDGAFVAQMRVGASKMGKGYTITMIVLGTAMATLGLYVWLFEGSLIGLALAVMMAFPVAFLAWMLKLRGDTE